MKGMYAGRRCFIAGNGPSLAHTPLGLLESEYSFGMNKIADIFPNTPWRPNFFIAVANGITFPSMTSAYIKAVEEAKNYAFVNAQNLKYVSTLEHGWNKTTYHIPRNVIPVTVTFKHRTPCYDLQVWSDDISESVSKDGSSMFAAMQIAVYLGFNPLYLIGCDLGIRAWDYDEEDDPNHFSPGYWGKLKIRNKPYKLTESYARNTQSHIIMGHRTAKSACELRGIEVYNATLGGEMEIYPRVDFMELFK
jgi:hypothetical protein